MTLGAQELVAGALLALAILLCLPLLSDVLQFVLPPVHRSASTGQDRRGENPRLLFLIPAHDEELLAASCVESVLAIDYPKGLFDTVLIADNCQDATASIARDSGAKVLERSEPENPGKPAALAWAIRRLDIGMYDACVILDADSVLDPQFARFLAQSKPLRHKATQTYFGLRNEWETWLTRLSGVLTRVRYEVSYPRKQRANINCPLTGNGMVIGSDLLLEGGWQAFSLTENWELYADYTADGRIIDLNSQARLYSEEAATTSQGRTQRTRWMAGRWSVFQSTWRSILASDRIGFRQKLDTLCELGRPSPALHLAMAAGVVGISLALEQDPIRWIVNSAVVLSLLPDIEGVFRVLIRHPKRDLILLDFVRLPGYVLWRVAITLTTAFGQSPTIWKKTERRQT